MQNIARSTPTAPPPPHQSPNTGQHSVSAPGAGVARTVAGVLGTRLVPRTWTGAWVRRTWVRWAWAPVPGHTSPGCTWWGRGPWRGRDRGGHRSRTGAGVGSQTGRDPLHLRSTDHRCQRGRLRTWGPQGRGRGQGWHRQTECLQDNDTSDNNSQDASGRSARVVSLGHSQR
jgi:hypothetical protein